MVPHALPLVVSTCTVRFHLWPFFLVPGVVPVQGPWVYKVNQISELICLGRSQITL